MAKTGTTDPLIVSVASQKGGVGKTSVAMAIAHQLGADGAEPAFVIDADLAGSEAAHLLHPPGVGRWPFGLIDVLVQSVGAHQTLDRHVGQLVDRAKELPVLTKPSGRDEVRLVPSYAERDLRELQRARGGLGLRAVADSYNRLHVRRRMAAFIAALLDPAGGARARTVVVDLTPFRLALTDACEELTLAAAAEQAGIDPGPAWLAGVDGPDWELLRTARWRWLEVVSPEPHDLGVAFRRWQDEELFLGHVGASAPTSTTLWDRRKSWFRACINKEPKQQKPFSEATLGVTDVPLVHVPFVDPWELMAAALANIQNSDAGGLKTKLGDWLQGIGPMDEPGITWTTFLADVP